MERAITEKQYEIHYYEVDYRKKALITSLIDYFNDVATFQSEDLGIGIDYMTKNNMAWILYKWDISVNRYPKYGEKVTVKTEPCGVRKFYAYRKFQITDSNGQVLANAKSIWLLINIKERKPLRINEHLINTYGLNDDNNECFKIDNIDKISEAENTIEFKVRYSDIDTNGHVNNEKYAAWLIESVPLEVVLNYTLRNMKITYRKEVKYGEYIKVLNSSKTDDNRIIFTHKVVEENGEEMTLGETLWEKTE